MKGQLTIITIIMLFISLFVLAVLAPLFNLAINMILNETTGDTASQMVASSIFFFMLLALVISIFGYGHYRQTQREYYG